jgi:16S rRNA (cytosine967-C5)-methyltransferase
MSEQPGVLARVHAARAVDAVLNQHGNLDQVLARESAELPDRDRALCQALAFGALRNHERARHLINQLLDKPLRNRDSVIAALLSVALFALTESHRPDYAVVSVSVDAAKRLGRPKLAGLVNAVLRRFLRERDALLAAAAKEESVRWSHPQWLIDAIRADWPADWEQILSAANEQAPMWLRVNEMKLSRTAWLAKLPAEQHGAEAPDWLASAVCLATPMAVAALPGFADGEVSVQDAASQFAASLLDAQPGMKVLDACAAPGGKTVHLLELTNGAIDLLALDIATPRLERIRENLDRLGLTANVVEGDAREPEQWAGGLKFDRILLDAPCSATGVIRRHPDIRYLREPNDIEAFANTQRELLASLWTVLKPGGRLLYSTCSVLRAENEAVVADFLGKHPEAQVTTLDEHSLAEIASPAGGGLGYQLLPGTAATDGFYYALMTRDS